MRHTLSINRYYCPLALAEGMSLDLPPEAARHVQVRRQQPGQVIELFGHRAVQADGEQMSIEGGVYRATIMAIGRSHVTVQVNDHLHEERELACDIHLAVVVPANDRMDFVVEKATELGASHIWPLHSERSVLRLSGDRAIKRQQHWQTLAANACAQSGRNRVPHIAPVKALADWWAAIPVQPAFAQRCILSTDPAAVMLGQLAPSITPARPFCLLSGPEGGFTLQEEQWAATHGFAAVSLGPAILRADTAPLAALSYLRLLVL